MIYGIGRNSKCAGLCGKIVGDVRMEQDQLTQMPKTLLGTWRGREGIDSKKKKIGSLR